MRLSFQRAAVAALAAVVALHVVSGFAPASARPVTTAGRGSSPVTLSGDAPQSPVDNEEPPSFLVTGMAATTAYDTSWYGGTMWAADSARWEAIPGGTWTFDTGLASAFTPVPGKPAGYHSLMEGWTGVDLTLPPAISVFRRMSTCKISGSYSMWMGATQAEADSMAWTGGQGYGNNWGSSLSQTFGYIGWHTSVTLQYQYAVNAEPGYDHLKVILHRSDNNTDTVLRTYDGNVSGTETIVLTGNQLPITYSLLTFTFSGESDGSYSDQDGGYTTTCGLAAIDNISLTGAITSFADFETDDGGWTAALKPGVGDFSDTRLVTDLPPVTGFFCSDCGLRDSVLVFVDQNGGHPTGQYSVAVSPWIDLKAGGDSQRPGRILEMSLYNGQAGVTPGINFGWQYYPWRNPVTGKIGVSPFNYNNMFYFYGSPTCGRYRLDLSGIPVGAEQVRIAVGPFIEPEAAPYMDNIRFGVYGPANAPPISVNYRFQDAFATDGTLNPSSTGRIDTDYERSTSPEILGDTLTVRGDGGNTEVRLVFHVRPGPFTSGAALAAAAARWTPEPSIGAGWYSARMDTAERAGTFSFVMWMSTFHESDPGFQGTDTTPDPSDPGHLANDILPDNLLTPGGRIDYFVKSRYVPPDPRNPGGTTWYVIPDTTGRNYWEMEVLPSSMAADTTWNCVLEVNGHDQSSAGLRTIEESALGAALGPGGHNAEGTRFDRWDVGRLYTNLMARPAGSVVGATAAQAAAYGRILWYAGSDNWASAADLSLLDGWLKTPGADRGFWSNGLDFAYRANLDGPAFLNNTLGVRFTCSTASASGCPGGSGLDSTYCLPLAAAAGQAFSTGPTSVRGNGCPDLNSFDVIAPDPNVPTAAGNLSYVKNGAAAGYASVTNDAPAGFSYRSVVDGFPVSLARRPALNPHYPKQCSNTTAVYERTAEVLQWLATPGCPAGGVSGVPEPPVAEPNAPARPWLGDATPNPMTRTTRISFQVSRENPPRAIEIFDVTGRLVRTLSIAGLEPGMHVTRWDGTTDAGLRVASGLYFYRMTAAGYTGSKKIMVLR